MSIFPLGSGTFVGTPSPGSFQVLTQEQVWPLASRTSPGSGPCRKKEARRGHVARELCPSEEDREPGGPSSGDPPGTTEQRGARPPKSIPGESQDGAAATVLAAFMVRPHDLRVRLTQLNDQAQNNTGRPGFGESLHPAPRQSVMVCLGRAGR